MPHPPARGASHADNNVREYARRAKQTLDAFLSSGRKQYLVISVDPAGGGEDSAEAFVVFLVCGDRFMLVTARVVSGHHRAYHFSTLPLDH